MIALPTVIIACLLADMFGCNTTSLSNVRLVALSAIMFGASICQGFCLLLGINAFADKSPCKLLKIEQCLSNVTEMFVA